MSTASRVRTLLQMRPYVLEALEENIANQSALSEKIASELGISNHYAVKAAVRRFASDLRKKKTRREEGVLRVLRQSTITMDDGLKVVVSGQELNLSASASLALRDTFVYLMPKSAKSVRPRPLRTHEDCGTFIVTSPPTIEETLGVVAFLTSLLAEAGINVIEFVSCYTKTLIVVEKDDVSRTYEIMRTMMG